VIYHQADEKAEVQRLEAVESVSRAIPTWMLTILSRLLGVSKYLAGGALGLITLSIVFASINHFWPVFDRFLDVWQQLNAANGARVVTEAANDAVEYFNDPFYETEGVKAIEERYNIKFKDLFVHISTDDVPENVYIMKDVFVDDSGVALKYEHGEAEDMCENLGGSLPHITTQNQIYPLKKYITLSRWADEAEWTSTGKSWSSDDYVVNLKSNGILPGMYMLEDGNVYADGNDVQLAARCIVLRDQFLDED
jgi:hypothetical protein